MAACSGAELVAGAARNAVADELGHAHPAQLLRVIFMACTSGGGVVASARADDACGEVVGRLAGWLAGWLAGQCDHRQTRVVRARAERRHRDGLHAMGAGQRLHGMNAATAMDCTRWEQVSVCTA